MGIDDIQRQVSLEKLLKLDKRRLLSNLGSKVLDDYPDIRQDEYAHELTHRWLWMVNAN